MNKEFYNFLLKYKMIAPIWEYELELIEKVLNVINKDDYLNIFAIYFSLICSGNVCMSLEEKTLKGKWEKQIKEAKILATDDGRYTEEEVKKATEDFERMKKISNNLYRYLNSVKSLNVINENSDDQKIFEIDDNYLYLRKYNQARVGIIKSIKRLFTPIFLDEAKDYPTFENCCSENIKLTDEQKASIIGGLKKNLIITGGPGTGKTTTILFLLIYLLANKLDYNIYLAAASGKASSRMKESIVNGINSSIKNEFIEKNIKLIDKISGSLKDDDGQEIEEFTIHRLLGIDFNTNGFKFNKYHQFPENSIFIIDEASMIDICLFNNLLEAIPAGARIFILGDKDQLPSVEVGAVFGELVEYKKLVDNKQVFKLVESKRFKSNTAIYELAQKVNDKDKELPNINFVELDESNPKIEFEGFVNKQLWNQFSEIDYKKIGTKPDGEEYAKAKEERDKCPVYYYLNKNNMERDGKKVNQKELIKNIALKWAERFYKDAQEDATDIDLSTVDLNKKGKANILDYLFAYTEEAKVLCAENEGIRGAKTINYYIKKKVIKKKEPVLSYQYPGQVMMINKNNKALNLYNGDTGILVSIKDDDTIYLMLKKTVKFIEKDEYRKDDIFKYGKYVFYPLRLITLAEIDLAFAITVHKSQGSDYDNILVILPTAKGHPLLNRQILYTAITRTKGYTYILSNIDSLNEAKQSVIERDTNIKVS